MVATKSLMMQLLHLLMLMVWPKGFVMMGASFSLSQVGVMPRRRCSMVSVGLPRNSYGLSMSATAPPASSSSKKEDVAEATGDKPSQPLLKRDRYVAINRFAVRKGKEAKFEHRWATRKSRLATLDGFKYFHLMRRVSLPESPDAPAVYDGGSDKDTSQGNYVSFTIWEEKKHFSAWRSGDAFKEAHGGTSIGAFLSTMINSALVLQGPPRPAFYDGLLSQSVTPDFIPITEDGWRKVENADGEAILPAECFVACNQFFVPPENGAAFEQRWAGRESALKECDGFVAFNLLRRDGSAKGHGTVPVDRQTEPSYVSATIWRDRKAFEAWKDGKAFKKAHGGGPGKGDNAPKPAPLWSKPPCPVFYEGTLVITCPEGA